jgi:hypothetical protein
MRLFSFCILTTLALLYAGLTVAETVSYRKWEQATVEQKDIQAKLQYFQNLNRIVDNLLHRMAYDSLHDPALAQFLKEKKINVVVKGAPPPPPASTNPPAAGDNAGPTTIPGIDPTLPPDKTAPAPSNSQHP